MSAAPNLGKEVQITALGRSWTVGRFTVKVWDVLLEWARPRLPDPFAGLDRLVDKVPVELAEKLISQAQSKALALLSMSSPQVQFLLDETPEGQVETYYQLLLAHHPDITRETVLDIVRELGEEKRRLALVKAHGEAPEGNALAPAA